MENSLEYPEKLRLATWLFVSTLVIFVVLQAIGMATGGHASQEAFELFSEPVDYTARMVAAGDTLRIILMGDMIFMVGYGTAIGMAAWAHADINRPAAWIAGLGILLVVGLDLIENITMFQSIDLVDAGHQISVERILEQANISAIKWLTSGMVLVVFTFTLPRETLLEKLLIWSTRLLMPIGTGLFITGAFDARILGGLIILSAMGGGLVMLALTTWLRVNRP